MHKLNTLQTTQFVFFLFGAYITLRSYYARWIGKHTGRNSGAEHSFKPTHTHTKNHRQNKSVCTEQKRNTCLGARRGRVSVCVCVFALWQHITKQQQQPNNAGQILSASDGNSILCSIEENRQHKRPSLVYSRTYHSIACEICKCTNVYTSEFLIS